MFFAHKDRGWNNHERFSNFEAVINAHLAVVCKVKVEEILANCWQTYGFDETGKKIVSKELEALIKSNMETIITNLLANSIQSVLNNLTVR